MTEWKQKVYPHPTVGQRLQMIMIQKNIKTQYELSEITGVSRPTISKIINDRGDRVSLSTLIRIANALDIELHELFESRVS